MKRLMTLMAAALLLVGMSTMAIAGTLDPSTLTDACSTCETEMSHINRGCEGQYEGCGCFDYEDFGSCAKDYGCTSYCEGEKGDVHRAILSLCTCLDEWPGGILDEDTLNISMEIVVKKTDGIIYTGDDIEGIEWCGDLDSDNIAVQWDDSKEDICEIESGWENGQCEPRGEYFYNIDQVSPTEIVTQDGLGDDVWGNIDSEAKTLLSQGKSAYGWIDIPEINIEQDGVDRAGWEIWVKVCLFNSRIYQCTACCCLIPIGIICCEETIERSNAIFPYFTEMNNASWWYGMVITNYGDADGTAKITVYEQDGDIAEGEVPVAAHNMAVLSTADLMNAVVLTTGGTLGDAKSYIEVEADFPVTGFAMLGKASTGESMGYLPIASTGSVQSMSLD